MIDNDSFKCLSLLITQLFLDSSITNPAALKWGDMCITNKFLQRSVALNH